MSAIRLAILSAGLMISLSPTAAQAGPFMDWLCGCSPNMSSQSTYAPAYVPTAVVSAPASGCSCAQQSTYYAPAVAYPTYSAPVTTYRPFLPIVPRPTTTYYTPSGYNPYSAAPVTVYRPVVPAQTVVTTTRLIPYTSYRMVYPTMVTYYGVAPVYNVAPAVTYPSPGPACSGAPVESYGPPSVGFSEGAAMEAPSLPPGTPTTSNYPLLQSPSTIIVDKPFDNSTSVNRQDNKTAAPAEPKAAPTDDSKGSGSDSKSPNSAESPTFKRDSLSNPPRNDSQDRTTMRPVRQVSRETVVAAQPAVRVLSGDIWRPAKD
jgi:hypothetical protein